jgi:hypothetical protein
LTIVDRFNNVDEQYFYMYAVGFLGSTAVELAAALRLARELDGRCPKMYKEPFYLFIRAMFAFGVAGPLPILLGATTLYIAFYIGASAPIVVDRLASGSSPGVEPKSDT